MRRQVAASLITCVSAVVLGSCAAPQKPTVDAAAIKSTIEGLNQKMVAAIAARDTDAVVNLYADDARVLPPNTKYCEARGPAPHETHLPTRSAPADPPRVARASRTA